MTANELAYEIIKCFGAGTIPSNTLDTFVGALAARLQVPITADIIEAAKLKIKDIQTRTRKDKDMILC